RIRWTHHARPVRNGAATQSCTRTRPEERVMLIRARRTALSLLVVAFLPTAAQQARGTGDGLPPRDEWQKVPEILAALVAAPGKRIADIAAGKGYLTKPLATAAGKSGRVYAVEIGAEALTALR